MKNCSTCNNIKEFNEFYKDKRSKDGYGTQCKVCRSEQKLIYYRTFEGLLSRIYGKQRASSIKRNHALPLYTKNELSQWVQSQSNFQNLWNNWVKSKYDMQLTPSVDRLDDSKGYSLSNIRLVTWSDNKTKGHFDQKFTSTRNSNTSGNRGVSWHNTKKKWGVSICCKGIRVYLGYHTLKEDAIILRKEAEATLLQTPDITPYELGKLKLKYK